jgi:hypothetical protein
VERDYYALSYATQLTIVMDVAKAKTGAINEDALQQTLAGATLNVSLANIQTGKTVDILSKPLTDFLTVPQEGEQALTVDVLSPGENEPYGSITAKWGQMEKEPGTDLKTLAG